MSANSINFVIELPKVKAIQLSCPKLSGHKSKKYIAILIDCISRAHRGGNVKIVKHYSGNKVITKHVHYGDYVDDYHVEQFFRFNIFLDRNLAALLTDIFGYIPFIKDAGDNTITNDRIKAENLKEHNDSIMWVRFAGVLIPKVFYEMSDYVENQSGACNNIEDLKVEDFPDYIQPHLVSALEKLKLIGRTVLCGFNDIVVYDFLGLDIINKNFTIIDDKFIICNALEYARMGYMGKRRNIHFRIKDKIPLVELKANPLCTPAIVAIYGFGSGS
jgi:hypothetical protein